MVILRPPLADAKHFQNLNFRAHGYRENEEKMRQKSEEKEEKVRQKNEVKDEKIKRKSEGKEDKKMERRLSRDSGDKSLNRDQFPCYDKGKIKTSLYFSMEL